MDTRIGKGFAVLAVAAFAALASGVAWAHGGRGHARVGVYFGGPVIGGYWGPYYAPRPWIAPPVYYVDPYGPTYYGPPAVAAPTVYIERAAPDASAYWYWCADPQGYYPTVQTCPGGWQPVAPQAPATR